MTLYDLTEDYKALLAMAEDGDLDRQTVADTLEGLDGEFEDKADGYAKIIRALEEDAKAVKDEMDRLRKRQKTLEANAKKLKGALEGAMRSTGKTKFKTALFSFGIQKNPAKVVVDDEAEIPQEFWIPQEPKLDRALISEFLKASAAVGENVEWAHFEQGESLRIR